MLLVEHLAVIIIIDPKKIRTGLTRRLSINTDSLGREMVRNLSDPANSQKCLGCHTRKPAEVSFRFMALQ